MPNWKSFTYLLTYILCLLTDGKHDKHNHNTGMTMHCIYWTTTTTSKPHVIRPHILFTDGRQRQIQPYFDHIVCLLTDDNNKPTIIRSHIVITHGRQQQTNHNTTTYCVYWRTTTTITNKLLYDHILCLLTDNNNKPNHNTTTYCVYWRTTTTTNPTIIPVWPCIVFTDRQQQQQIQP